MTNIQETVLTGFRFSSTNKMMTLRMANTYNTLNVVDRICDMLTAKANIKSQ